MTPAERQRRYRDANVTRSKAMTKSEREELGRLVRQRERVLKTMAKQRSAELLAEFERQMAQRYHYDQDQTWNAAHQAAREAVDAAREQVEARCAELGIPKQFAPNLQVYWWDRGENAVKERRGELRKVATSRIAALEKAAIVEIERQSLQAQIKLAEHMLSSEAAQEFLASMPTVEELMPPLELQSIESMLKREQTWLPGRDRLPE